MSLRSIPHPAELSAIMLLVLLPQPTWAAWPAVPTGNVALCVSPGAQTSPDAASDATGGAIVAWDDQRNGPRDIYVQRVDGTGTPRWTFDGVVLCNASGEQYAPQVVPDGSGGAIVTWSDFRGVAFDIYAQRVDSSGAPQWTPNGVAICTASNFQAHPQIVPDGSGGAIITWDDTRTGNNKIYAQRVNASGVPQWTANGVLLTNATAGQARPVIVSNGAGGAIIAWEDVRNGSGDIYCQHILASGVRDPAWPAAGRAVSAYLGLGRQETPVIAIDGNGGAFIAWAWDAWTDDIHVQRVLASGVVDPAWPGNGRVIAAGNFDQTNPAIMADGAGGAIVCWDELRWNDGYNRDINAQHVLATGALDPAWPPAGSGVCLKTGNQQWPRMVPDGAGGAIVTWNDLVDAEADIFAQHVMSTGVVDPAWPDSGRALSTAGLRQIVPTIVADGAGGAVVAWQDGRSGSGDGDNDIYVQGVKANGQLGDAPVDVPDVAGLDFTLDAPRPNPSRTGAMIVRFTLPSAAAASLELFDVAGRRVVAREVGSLGPGHHAIDVVAGRRPGAGIYFVRLQQGQDARVRRIVVLDE